MAYITLLFTTLFAFLIAIFAVQNSMIVNVNLLVWNIEASLVLVILGAASLGFLMALSLQFYAQLKMRYQLYKAKSRIKQLEEELARKSQPGMPEPAIAGSLAVAAENQAKEVSLSD